MSKTAMHVLVAAATLTAAIAPAVAVAAGPADQAGPADDDGWRRVVKPRPLSKAAERGLKWLVEQQLESGAWGQGEESRNMGRNVAMAGAGNVGDTCFAALALMRAGSTPAQGRHMGPVRRGVEFVLREVERSDDKSMSVTQVNGTRLQAKIGPYIDTFASVLLLSELKGKMPDDRAESRVSVALDKVLAKIHRNQRADGTWDDRGWAPALSQAIGTKGINRAAQAGAEVDDGVLERAEGYAKGQFDSSAGTFGGAGSAGVQLYSAAASAGAMADADGTNAQDEAEVRHQAANAPKPAEREAAKAKLARIEDTRRSKEAATDALVGRLDDPSFTSGFGSNGGEEFLSYMLIAETLVTKGGKQWTKWSTAMAQNLARIQNRDGSWTGHHCITGRTFCTAAALLVLTADRAPVPLASKVRRG